MARTKAEALLDAKNKREQGPSTPTSKKPLQVSELRAADPFASRAGQKISTLPAATRMRMSTTDSERVDAEGRAAAAPRRVEAKPATDEAQIRNAAAWNKANRRELTTDEWNRLDSKQQEQVRFNSSLLQAYDADMAESPKERRNTAGLLSQLGLDPDLEKRLTGGLGLGVGPAVTYNDLFGPQRPARATDVAMDSITPLGGNRVDANKDARQVAVDSIASKLEAFLGKQDEANAQTNLATALARKDEYSFASPQAKADYEVSFDFLRDRNSLSTASWRDAVQSLTSAGYDPEDFKAYARERLQMLPTIDGQTTLQELDSWFSQ